jgi:hypothetical protein
LQIALLAERNGQVLGFSIGGQKEVAMLICSIIQLNLVHHYVLVTSGDLVEKTKPWEIAGLMNGNDHGLTFD